MKTQPIKKYLLGAVSSFLAYSQVFGSAAVLAQESVPVPEAAETDALTVTPADGSSFSENHSDSRDDQIFTEEDEDDNSDPVEKSEPVNWAEEDSFSWIIYGDRVENGTASVEIGFQFDESVSEITENDYAELLLPEGIIIDDQDGSVYSSGKNQKEVIGSYEIDNQILRVDFFETLNQIINEEEITRIPLQFTYSDPNQEISWLLNKSDEEPYILNRQDEDHQIPSDPEDKDQEGNDTDDSEDQKDAETVIVDTSDDEISGLSGTEINGGADRDTAELISVNTEYTKSADGTYPDSWFKISNNSNGGLSLILKPSQQFSEGAKISIYDVDGKELFNRFYYSYECSSEITSPSIGISKGTYYICIEAYEHYSFRLNFTESNFWESEPNDTWSTANPISVDNEYKGSHLRRDDEDWYKLEIAAPGSINIRFKHPEGQDNSWNISLYDSSVESENYPYPIYEFTSAGNETDQAFRPVGVRTGTYYLKIYSNNVNNESDYSFQVDYSDTENWEAEPNNTWSTANPISVNKEYKGSSRSWNDEDWYKLEIAFPGSISIRFKHPEIQDNNWYISLYDSRLETQSNAYQLFEFTSDGNETDQTFRPVGVTTGTYYLKIVSSAENDYSFQVDYSNSSNWESEPNNTISTADQISVNQEYKAGLDEDWFKFEIPASGKLNIRFKHPRMNHQSAWIDVDLYDSRIEKYTDEPSYNLPMNLVLSSLCSRNNETDKISESVGVQAGTYYLLIDGNYYAENIDYSFQVNFTPSSDWETEPNNTVPTADSISVNHTYYGSSGNTHDDSDWFKFNVPSQGTLRICLQIPDSSETSYTQAALYDGSIEKLDIDWSADPWGWGEEIQNKWLGGVGSSDKKETDLKSVTIGVSAGTYYVKVNPGSEYSFYIDYVKTSGWETELNNSISTADKIEMEKTYHGSISGFDDIDYYSFDLTKSTPFSILMTKSTLSNASSADCSIILYDSEKDQISDRIWFDKWTSRWYGDTLKPGRYYLCVEGFSDELEYQFTINPQLPFVDVPADHWSVEHILEATQLGIIQGYDSTHFGPHDNLSRTMAVTILWRMAGQPVVEGSHSFQDVKSTDWFHQAILWASKNGIANGYNPNQFGPHDNVNREQLAVMIVNYLKYRGVNTYAPADLSYYKDSHLVHDYAVKAMKYCVYNGILSGTDYGTRLDPMGNATRAQAAKMLTTAYRLQFN